MKKDQEILDEFGNIIVENIVDRQYKGIEKTLANGFKNPTMQAYNSVFEKLSNGEKDLLKKFIIRNNHSILFDFLKIFEEHPQFKLYFENEDQKVNLVEISEMLKAEPIIENGWIARFSKEVDKDEII